MKKRRLIFLILIASLILTSCSVSNANISNEISQGATITPSTSPSPTQTMTPTSTATPTATSTKTLTPTITPTPWALSSFTSSLLYPNVIPVDYLETCTYLENKWGEGKSEPGTIVVPIMFHSILKEGREVTDSSQMTTAYFEYFMQYAQEMGFETITTAELVGFLMENEAIPERSMILILDDRRPDTPQLFMPYLEENDWTLTLAWPTTEDTPDSMWQKIEGYVATGYVEVQSHGHYHAAETYIQEYTPLEVVEVEIYRPIDVILEHFGVEPLALIWPGGNFTDQAVDMAQEAGYEIGFTAYSRGPLMFNWIPLGEVERAVDDPLMVLPRYWSSAAHLALDEAVAVGEAYGEAAAEVKEEEFLYYSLYCRPGEGE